MTSHMDRFQEMQIFTRIVERRSFSAAAEDLQLPRATVTNAIKRLERRLGARLLERTTRVVAPTLDGQAYYERASLILAELDAAQEVVDAAVTQIAGPIRLSAPLSFGVQHLSPALAEFAVDNPRVELDVSFDDRTIDLIAGGFDLAVRIGRLKDSALVARRIAPVRKVVTATLSADHRVSDGHRGALFLAELKRLVREPERLG